MPKFTPESRLVYVSVREPCPVLKMPWPEFARVGRIEWPAATHCGGMVLLLKSDKPVNIASSGMFRLQRSWTRPEKPYKEQRGRPCPSVSPDVEMSTFM